MTACANCESEFHGQFCPNCGQKDIDLERPLTDLLGEVLRETFDVDGRAFRTLWTLFRRPGVLTSEFLAGRRKLYSPPIRLYLIISLLFFLVAAWVVGQGVLLEDGQTLATDAQGQGHFFAVQVPRLMFVLLPAFALLLKAAFWQRPYFHHLIHSLHLHSAAYVVFVFILPLERAADQFVLAMIVQSLFSAYLLASFVVSIRRVYQANWPIAIVKAIVVLLGYSALVLGSFEAVSYFTMSSSSVLPFLTD